MEKDEILQKIEEMDNSARTNLSLKTVVSDTVGKILDGVETDKLKIKVNKIWSEDKFDNDDIKAQHLVRNRNQNWVDEVRADLSVIDKETGKEIDRVKSLKVSSLPKLTPRNTYLLGGNEYQFMKQSRLKPGVYTRQQDNGEISSFFNVDKTVDFERGFNNNFKINFEPERKTFMMTYGTKNVPLINVLHAIGVKPEEIKKKWGAEVYAANEKLYGGKDVVNQKKMHEAIFGKEPEAGASQDEIRKLIKDRLFSTELDADTTKITLGKSYSKVDEDVLLAASKKVVDVYKGDVEPDERDALVFKSFYDAEDHIREKLVKNADKIKNSIKFRLSRTGSINKSISSKPFDAYTIGTITNSQLSNPPTQTNLLSTLGEGSKITIMGEGGISNTNQVSGESRNISNSEMGFIDPLHTPEGGSIGVAVHHTMGAVKVGNDLYSQFVDKKGKKAFLKPADVHGKVIAFADEYDKDYKPVDDEVRAIKDGKITTVKPSEVDYIIKNSVNMFDVSVNMIPFLDSIQGNRGLTAAKMKEQALPLKDRDKPLWKIVDRHGMNISALAASQIALPKSKVDGEVESVTADEIVIKDRQGKKHTTQLYNNFPLNAEAFITNDAKVAVGDKVKKGDLLADNNNTRDGEFALGANLRVAYVPWKGYNYEDGTIVSESAAKKLTSEHLYNYSTKRSADGVFSRSKFKAYYPEEMNSKQAAKLDADGVVKVGTTVDHDDILIAHMEHKAPTADDLALGRLDKQLKKDHANMAVRWDKGEKGVVTSVEKHGNTVTVNVKTEEQLKQADKLSGLHGNKHIVAKIVPDHEMPITEDGKRIDITMSPIGVSNRINTSQLLEAAAGKIAEKTGRQYVIQNFKDADNAEQLVKDMKDAGVEEKEYLIDPTNGKKTQNKVFTGVAHVLKLEHKVDHKFSARYREGYDSNQQPISGGETGGKNISRMEIGALLARGANENLKEMFNIKGQRNDAFWKALETGQSLPPPQKPFIWDKMTSMMRGAGINVEQNGKSFKIKPITDADILKLSSGEISEPSLTYRKKDFAPMRNGLFDPIKTGGMMGDNYTHFKLPEKILNPLMEAPTAVLLGMTQDALEDIINGKKFVNPQNGEVLDKAVSGAVSGGPAIEALLKRIDVDDAYKAAEEQAAKSKNASDANKANKKLRYLKEMKASKRKPTDYMIENVLVVPPKHRPMFTMGVDNTVIMSDVNELYQQTAASKEAMEDMKKSLDESGVKDESLRSAMLAPARAAIYQDVKAVMGLREPTAYLHKIKDKKGFVAQIDGGKKQTKEGFYQDKVVSRRQDLVGRSTIIPDPNLRGDEVGIPKPMAKQLFKPFVMKKIVSLGYTPLEAQKHVEEESKTYQKALELAMDERPLILNRAPTLHRWNMTAFKPVLVDGKAIRTPSVVVNKFFGGDYDGDSAICKVFISIKISKLRQFFSTTKKIAKYKKIRCGSIDFDNARDYLSFITQRKVTMPSQTKLPVRRGEDIIHIDLEDFPRLEHTKRVSEKGTICYDVPEGVSIYTTDEQGVNPILCPVTEFSIHPNLSGYVVDMKNGDEVIVSTDHSLVVMNMLTGKLEKIEPEFAMRKAIPKVIAIDPVVIMDRLSLTNYLSNNSPFGNKGVDTVRDVKLNDDIGYVIGAVVGDGWVPSKAKGSICLANVDDGVGSEFCRIIDTMLVDPCKDVIQDNVHEFDEYVCYSKKWTKQSKALAENFGNWIGYGAYNKHLPPFFMSTPECFRLGLLAGLIDTDGTATWVKAKAKTSSQFVCFYSTMSERLAIEIVTLCRSLKIRASITVTAKKEYRITLSATDIHNKNINLRHKNKKAALQLFQEKPMTENQLKFGVAANDYVPFSETYFDIAKKHFKPKSVDGCYDAIYNGGKLGIITRLAAKKIIAKIPQLFPQWWIDVVNNTAVTWTAIKELKPLNKKVTMYDITVPGPYTFMCDNGIVVQDTMQVHVPIGPKAVSEAYQMMASSDVIKTGHGISLISPDQDITTGAWLVSKGKGGKDVGKFDSLEAAVQAHKDGKIEYADTVDIDGIKAPLGMHVINSVIPEDVRDYKKEITNKNFNNWVVEIAKKHNDKIAMALSDKIKDISNDYNTVYGLTLGVSDTLAHKESRDKFLKPLKGRANDKDFADKAVAAQGEMQADMKARYTEDTMPGIPLLSGGGKGINNMSQIAGSPVIVQDFKGRPVKVPIMRGYSEGLKTGEYWAAAQGARYGNVQKSILTYLPGYITSELVNSVYNTRVSGTEPVDIDGIESDAGNAKHVEGRYLAKDVKDDSGRVIAHKNDVVNSDTMNKFKKAKIKTVYVQSPLTDPTPGDGISSYSYGVDFRNNRPQKGANIGIISAHTITEPAVNMALKAVHTGGTLISKGGDLNALNRVLHLAKEPPQKATLASVSGRIKSITPSSIGGMDLVINNGSDDHDHYLGVGRAPTYGVGASVSKGDRLSDGNVSAHDVLKYKGIKHTQKFLVDELDEINEGKIDRRNLEVLVRGITNTTRIKKADGAPWVAGDVAPLSTIENYNRNRAEEMDVEDAKDNELNKKYHLFDKGMKVTDNMIRTLQEKGINRIDVMKPEIKHEPFLSAGGISGKPALNENWLARLSHNRLEDVLVEGAARGWISDDSHPIANLVTGV